MLRPRVDFEWKVFVEDDCLSEVSLQTQVFLPSEELETLKPERSTKNRELKASGVPKIPHKTTPNNKAKNELKRYPIITKKTHNTHQKSSKASKVPKKYYRTP